jgi:hypothetical protein
MRTVLFLLTAVAAAAQSSGNLGIFEAATDVGTPSHKGSVSYDAALKEYRISGGGNNMWFGRDDFYYVWKKMTGDVVVSAKLTIITPGNNHRKAGILIRKDLSPGAVYADAIVHGDGLTALQWREQADDVTRSVHFPINAPTRIRLERRRNQVRMFAAPEGGLLTELGYIELSPFAPMYVGLGVCAHDDNAETTAVFSDVTIEPIGTGNATRP